MTKRRVAVFVDYQNVYRHARRAFFDDANDPHQFGQFRPQRLGIKLAGAGDPDRELMAVRVYRGEPSKTRDPYTARGFDRQANAWRAEALTNLVTRPLNYRTTPPREKGVDVRIAIDFVTLAMRDEYEIGILFCSDTDLLPALEAVRDLSGKVTCEVAAWKPGDGRPANQCRR